MARHISSRLSFEYAPKNGVHFPESTFRNRNIQPSYTDDIQGAQVISGIEPITVNIPVGSLTANQSTTVTQTQGLDDLTSIRLRRFDTGHVLITNVSTVPPANTMVGHPTIQIVTAQGNPQIGVLTPGQSYSQISLKVSATVTALTAANAGTLTVTATALLVGGVKDV